MSVRIYKILVFPLAGVVGLCVGMYFFSRVPSPGDIGSIRDEIQNLKVQIKSIEQLEKPDSDRFIDQLPMTLAMGQVLEVIERAARASGIESISITAETNSKSPANYGPHSQGAVSAAPMEGGGENTPDYGGSTGIQGQPHLDHLKCKLNINSQYASLIKFLGKIESGNPVMRIKNLLIKSKQNDIQADVEIWAYYLPLRVQKEG